MHPRSRPIALAFVAGAVVAHAPVLVLAPSPAYASASALPASARAVDGGAAAPADGATFPTVRAGEYTPPLDRPVLDPFRMDAGPYGPGNRGLEYGSRPGDAARSIGAGQVLFAGLVAGRLVVTVRHRDGRRSSLTGLVSIEVGVGDLVLRGQILGLAGERLHLGVREGDRYVDPARLFTRERRRAVLVP